MGDAAINDPTWPERLVKTLLTYFIVLAPIAFIVITTKYRLCPGPLQTNTLVHWFVNGEDPTISQARSSTDKHDDGRLLLNDQQEKSKQLKTINNTFEFLFCLLGLQISYLIWGLLQEKIMTTEYPITRISTNLSDADLKISKNDTKYPPGHSFNESQVVANITMVTFHDSQFLVFINRIVAFISAILALVYAQQRETNLFYANRFHLSNQRGHQAEKKPRAPLYEYIYCSLSNILSSWCQYEALKFVNFPTQCLSKSCKVIPVMLMSKILLRKKYPFSDYLCAILLAIGMFVFMLNQPLNMKHDNQAASSNHWDQVKADSTLFSGLIILALYLTFDSFTSNWQQSLYSRYCISNWQMMAAINFYSILLTLTSLHQLGNLKPAFDMLASSSQLLRDCMLMSIMSSTGQMFVYYTIKRFGSVIFAVIMTLRQFLSILLSCTIYGHQLNFSSRVGLILVLLVVGYQLCSKSKESNKKPSASQKIDKNACIQFKLAVNK